MTLPTYFISHGAPTLILEDGPTCAFLRDLGRSLARPRVVLVVSAHWETDRPTLSAATAPETIHDFYGFPETLYRIRYGAPGAPAVAAEAARLLNAAGIPSDIDAARGLDHGAWVPLMLMYPDADIPVLQLSIQPQSGTAHHVVVGRALAPLRDEGVLIMATGSLTHNLRELSRDDSGGIAGWAEEFAGWMAAKLHARDDAALLDYRRQAPHAQRSHPTDEHLLPLYVALGAATPQHPAERLHASFAHGSLAMDTYLFN